MGSSPIIEKEIEEKYPEITKLQESYEDCEATSDICLDQLTEDPVLRQQFRDFQECLSISPTYAEELICYETFSDQMERAQTEDGSAPPLDETSPDNSGENTLSVINYAAVADCSFEQSGHFVVRTCSVLISVEVDYQVAEPAKYISCSANSTFDSELVENKAGSISLEFPARTIKDTFDDEDQNGAADTPGINTFGKDVSGEYAPIECYISLSAGDPTTTIGSVDCRAPEDPEYNPICTAPFVEFSP